MLSEGKTKQFVSELKSLMLKYDIRIFYERKKLYFKNDEINIRVNLDEALEPNINNSILNSEETNKLIIDFKKLLDNNNISIKGSGHILFFVGQGVNIGIDEELNDEIFEI